jgi:hypothetical protein
LLKNKDIMSSPLASIDLPAMDLSSSIFDFDFGAGFDDFGVEVFDDFGADFERDSDYDFLGTAFDAGFDSTVEDSVTAEFLGIGPVVVVVPVREDVFGVPTVSIVSRASLSRHGLGILLAQG